MIELLEKLRRRIIASGMGPRELERASGVSAAVVSRFVSGERKTLTMDTAVRLAKAVDCELTLTLKGKGKVRHGKRGA